MFHPLLPFHGVLICSFLLERRRAPEHRDNWPLGAGVSPALEQGSQAGAGGELQLRLRELLDPVPPKPPHERVGRAGGSLPITYDLCVIPKCLTQPPVWAGEGFVRSPVAPLKSPSVTQVTQSLSALAPCESHKQAPSLAKFCVPFSTVKG